MKRISLICLLAATLLATAPLQANREEASEQQLQQLRQDINRLQGWLTQARGEQSQLQDRLKQTESQIGQLVTRIEANTREAAELEQRLTRLRVEQRELQTQLDQQAGYLRQQIRSAYAMGRQEYLKVLLNQQEPDRVARLLRYYDYINRERTRKMEAYLAVARQLDTVQSEIITRGQTLDQVRRSLQQRRTELLAEQRQRQQLVQELSREIAGRDDELQKLLADQKRLEQLLEAVTEAIVRLPPPRDARPFQQMRGNLPWPIQGRVLSAFGSRQHNNRLVSRGMLIQASEGAPVQAIHGGRVVFADWLRGFGFMIIIDHGDGFMSLYGHNQTLRKQPGDWVNGGEVIATAGATGGQQQTGLYFEIRRQGQPVDPVSWIARR
ncbi:murein hydrolase activator EnvC family protein [Marinospirillum alkaliphilum]|uniref:Septal ring factor EnvC, activator of murein hydrolases AmiA and AmiB n=1 Tax=Marinospirillum alkaliphilum DSM 21637 TaxID=1122209 RepID=A0A1K1WRG5_9GAMM|nr:peptidoglycan DD-metalloendopeptidase family protein [Marinospirillum alkaliphilum]SFX39365.1 Septal ring factor EnvC, activator of murein hydrolases AmiA and AmiB [Marinospirillum alkaliphilum DSM 21637]